MRLAGPRLLAAIALCAGVAITASTASSPVASATPSSSGAGAHHGSALGRAVPSSGMTIGLSFYLPARNDAALTRFITAASTPGSSSYHHYLRKGEYAKRFGASTATILRVTSYLVARGLHAVAPSPDHLFVHAAGTVPAVEALFRTTIRAYDDNGHRVYADVAPSRLPSALAGSVGAVVGLTEVPRYGSSYTLDPHTRPRTTTCAQMTAGTNPTSGPFTIAEVGNAYKYGAFAAKGAGGQGETVAIFELTDYIPSDIKYFQDCTGKHDTISSVTVDGGNGLNPYAEVEADLDIEIVATLAPYANIDVYQGPNSEAGVVDTYDRIATDDAAKVVSTSWGLCERVDLISDRAESGVFQEMAAQGQTVAAAAGDSGASDCLGYRSTRTNPLAGAIGVDDPASQPYVTALGGTTITDASTIGSSPSSEVVWDTSDVEGTGGGVSSIWPAPSYQHAIPGASGAGRTVPDLAMNADPASGYMIYTLAYGWIPVGGTSAAAPMFAALMALADQYNATTYGFVLPLLYAVGNAEPGKYFNDVTIGNNETYDVPGYSTAKPGFDAASGWGSPIASAFLSLTPPT
jgi:kumamolisin